MGFMMKSCLLITFCVCMVVISCSNSDGTLIKGEISNLEYPYILSSYLSADTLVIDTILVDNRGKFNHSITIDTLTTFSLYMNNYESATVVFADKGQKINVKGDALFPDLIRINGNEINDDLTLFKKINSDLLKLRGQLLINMRLDRNSDSAGMNSLTRHDEIANLNLFNHELTLKAEEFIKENPTKPSSLILISNFFMNSDNPKALERVLGYMEGDVTNSQIARRLMSYSEKVNRSAEGAMMPYFQLTGLNGETIHSYDFSGKHLLLSFISTSGIESRETVEFLKNEYAELHGDSVEFISIYIDSDIYPIDYVEHDSIPWIVVPEKKSWGSDIVDKFNVQYVPFNILINPDGTIKERNVAAQKVVDTVKDYSGG